MRRLLGSVLAASVSLIACVGADKGEEEDIPGDGKDDSFYSPTSHGDLSFGLPGEAEVTATAGFHTWTFKLSANATVNLQTADSTGNLDTVMYLYKRTSPTASWGSYVKKNDDANDETSESKLGGSLGKGEYRVLVKGYKRAQRGTFALEGTCSGAGCPAASVWEDAVDLPADTGYGGDCGATLGKIFAYGSVDATDAVTVNTNDRCNLPALKRLAMDYYVSYFDGDLLDTELEIETKVLGGAGTDGGTLIDVTDGGDESGMTFVFDTSNKLVALYQHNQSPDVRFFCRAPARPVVDLPNVEDCVGSLVNEIVHDGDDESDFNLVAAPNNLPIGLKPNIMKPMQRYAASRGTASSTKLTVEGATWELFDGRAARISISATGKPATQYLSTNALVLLETPSDGAAKLVCE